MDREKELAVILTRYSGELEQHLPKDHSIAVIIVGPGGQVACNYDMDPVKLAVVLGRLTEDLVREAKALSKNKAKKILHDGEVKGKPITKKQRGLMGLIASGKKPTKY
jgi:hypothetical protein